MLSWVWAKKREFLNRRVRLLLLRLNTLPNLAPKYLTPVTRCLQRQIICYNNDAKEIYYHIIKPVFVVEERHSKLWILSDLLLSRS